MMKLEKIIGHRGASAYAPENTIPSFQKALQLGCHWVEFDVMLSQDGEIFVFHDDSLQRTTTGLGELSACKSSYLKTLDAGSWFSRDFQGTPIPTLSEVIVWLAQHGMQANIEIKTSPNIDLTIAVIEHLEKYWPKNKDWPLVSSFDYQSLCCFAKQKPELPLGFLLDKWTTNVLDLSRAINCFSVHLSKKIATKSRIASIKEAGYAVGVYTVNQRALAFKLLDWGVDTLFSDYPDLLST